AQYWPPRPALRSGHRTQQPAPPLPDKAGSHVRGYRRRASSRRRRGHAVTKTNRPDYLSGSWDGLQSSLNGSRVGGKNRASSSRQIGHNEIGLSSRVPLPECFVAVVDQDRAAAGAMSRFDVVEDVADHPRAGEIKAKFIRSADQHARRWL